MMDGSLANVNLDEKCVALRREIQIGIDAAQSGDGVLLETEQDISNFMAQFYN